MLTLMTAAMLAQLPAHCPRCGGFLFWDHDSIDVMERKCLLCSRSLATVRVVRPRAALEARAA